MKVLLGRSLIMKDLVRARPNYENFVEVALEALQNINYEKFVEVVLEAL